MSTEIPSGVDAGTGQTPPDPAEKIMTDISFAGFQMWAIGGVILTSIIMAIISGGRGPYLYFVTVLFVGAGCVGGCLIANRYGKRYGIPVLVVPVLLLAGGLWFMPPELPFEYQAMLSIRAVLENAPPDPGRTIWDLSQNGLAGRKVPTDLGQADYYHAPDAVRRSLNGYWFAFVQTDQDGVPFTNTAADSALCAFPETYGVSGTHVYLMDARGGFFRIDMKAAKYIKSFPGPDPLEKGWQQFQVRGGK
ncbi:MAG: hypothetical protein ABIF71_12355 [Planctomycetota bacterium]